MPSPEPSVSGPNVLWSWTGPPSVRVEAREVRARGREWTQLGVVTAEGREGAVAVVQHEGAVLLVRQYRPLAGESLWELPRGFGDVADAADADAAGTDEAGEDEADQGDRSRRAALHTAEREVLEETGLELERARLLGRIWPDSGLLAGRVSVVAGEVVSRLATHPADGEVDALRWVPDAELEARIADGTIRDGLSLAALSLWRAHQPTVRTRRAGADGASGRPGSASTP